jgi:hypothetical protein
VRTQSQPALEKQQRRNGARYQQQIIEMTTQKWRRNLRFQHPTIQAVQRAPEQKQRIPKIKERSQSSASITNPKPSVNTNFRNNTIPQSLFQV